MNPIQKTAPLLQVVQAAGTKVPAEAIVKQLYEKASVTDKNPERISDELSELIANNIEIFIPQANSSSSRMPARFQEAMVIFIRSRTNGDVFTQTDITNALQAIKEKVTSPVLEEEIVHYEQNVSDHLLDTGMVFFYAQTGKQINLNLT